MSRVQVPRQAAEAAAERLASPRINAELGSTSRERATANLSQSPRGIDQGGTIESRSHPDPRRRRDLLLVQVVPGWPHCLRGTAARSSWSARLGWGLFFSGFCDREPSPWTASSSASSSRRAATAWRPLYARGPRLGPIPGRSWPPIAGASQPFSSGTQNWSGGSRLRGARARRGSAIAKLPRAFRGVRTAKLASRSDTDAVDSPGCS